MKKTSHKPAYLRTCVPAYLLLASASLSTSAYAAGVAAASEYFQARAGAQVSAQEEESVKPCLTDSTSQAEKNCIKSHSIDVAAGKTEWVLTGLKDKEIKKKDDDGNEIGDHTEYVGDVTKIGAGDWVLGSESNLEKSKKMDIQAGRLVLADYQGIGANQPVSASIDLKGEDSKFVLNKGAALAGSGKITAKNIDLNGTVALEDLLVKETSSEKDGEKTIEKALKSQSSAGELDLHGNVNLTGATIEVDYDGEENDQIHVKGKDNKLTIGEGNTINMRGLRFGTDGKLLGDVITAEDGADIATDAKSIALTVGGKAAKDVDFLDEASVTAAGKKVSLAGGLRWFSDKKETNQDGKEIENGKFTAHGNFTIDAGSLALNGAISDSTHVTESAKSVTGWDGKTLTKLGSGTLILNGKNTYTGDTKVEAGTLWVGDEKHHWAPATEKDGVKIDAKTGATIAKAIVGKNGILSGFGTVMGDAKIAGRLQGKLNIGGTATMQKDSVLDVDGITVGALKMDKGSVFEVNTTAGDALVKVTKKSFSTQDGTGEPAVTAGDANIDGAILRLAVRGDKIKLGSEKHAILTAEGEVKGKFVLGDDLAFIKTDLAYLTEAGKAVEGNEKAVKVELTADRNDVKFSSVAHTNNQNAVGGALDALEQLGKNSANTTVGTHLDQDDLNNVLVAEALWMGAEEARRSFDNLSGEIYGATRAAVMGDQQLHHAVMRRTGVPGEPGQTLWVSPWGQKSRLGGTDTAAGVNMSGNGLALGVDLPVGDSAHAGVFVAYEDKDVKSTRQGLGRTSIDGYSAGAYAVAQAGLVQVRGGVAYSALDMDTQRDIAFGSIQGNVTSEHTGKKTQVFAEVAVPLTVGEGATVSPYLGLTQAWLHTSAAQERGNAAALSVRGQTDKALFSTFGLRAAVALPTQHPVSVTADLGWMHAAGDVNGQSQHRFAGAPADFSVNGRGVTKNTFVTGLGLQAQLGVNAQVGLGYEGQFGSGHKNHSATARLQVRF